MITNRDRDVVDWIARIGAVQADHVMFRFGMGRTVTCRRLAALESAGLVKRSRVLHGEPGLITATRAGLRLCGLERVGVTRVSAGAARHWQACAVVAVLLERRYGRGSVGGVGEIRAAQRSLGEPVARASVGAASHLPDLVVWGPQGAGRPGGTAIEVELTVKAPERLRAIVDAWWEATHGGIVTGALYVCSPHARRAVIRAIEATGTKREVRVAAMPDLDVLAGLHAESAA